VEDVVVPALTRSLAGTEITTGAAMCPEFLREGSGVADFFASPLVVIGASDPRVAEAVTKAFDFLDRPARVVDIRIAEALKYACNAFHATKVSFTNELSRLFRLLGVDSREVKGFDVRIYDPVVKPARLVGANRRYIESKLPHLRRLLAHDPGEALHGADVAIISTGGRAVLDALLMAPPRRLIDLSGRLGSEVESLPGYEGIGW
jgi:hypothetical protein